MIMIKILAIVLSTVVMVGLVWAWGAVGLIGAPMIILAILFDETRSDRKRAGSMTKIDAGRSSTDF